MPPIYGTKYPPLKFVSQSPTTDPVHELQAHISPSHSL